MPIEFRKFPVAGPASEQKGPPSSVPVWIPPASKMHVEEQLFSFLRSLRDGSPEVTTPLLVEEKTLQALYTNPHPDLLLALTHCLDQLLVQMSPDPACWGTLDISASVLGVALVAYNCLCSPVGMAVTQDPVVLFTSALIDTLSPAQTLSDMLAYHAVLHQAVEAFSFLAEDRVELMQSLLDRSPLSTLCYLHLYTPPPLTAVAADLWSWWKTRVVRSDLHIGLDDWLQPLTLLLEQPAIAAYVRRHWLSLPDSLPACRNLGLLLEALRRQGKLRAVILEFYEAFDYFRAERIPDAQYGKIGHWPLLNRIENLLRAGGYGETSIRLNRDGNEYFALFGPLLQIIVAENGPPADYYHLNDLIPALRPLLSYTTGWQVARPQLSKIEFFSKDKS